MKKILALCLILIFAISLAGCSKKNLQFDIGEASQVQIKSGLTGDEVIIDDADLIKEITDDINALRFEKLGKVEGAGYAYMLTWMDGNGNEVERITITEENGYQISRDGYYYKVGADLAIDVELIANVIENNSDQ